MQHADTLSEGTLTRVATAGEYLGEPNLYI